MNLKFWSDKCSCRTPTGEFQLGDLWNCEHKKFYIYGPRFGWQQVNKKGKVKRAPLVRP